ncbi:hypothetical protein HY634_02425 [Candidatus Uhrbacteria bacterium]|nr:hypothetical protein [Candidatus Uhrbacteria bacterium]
MFLTVHATAGALVGGWTGNPLVAFALGIVSHIILDIIPHGDEHIAPECTGPTCTHREEIRFLLRLAIMDAIVMSGVLATVLYPWIPLPSNAVLAGIFGSVLPDLIQGLATVFPKRRALVRLKQLHDYFHCGIIRYESPVVVGMFTQMVALVLLVIAVR